MKSKRVSKQNTLISESSRQKAILNNNVSQEIDFHKSSGLLKKNRSNCSQKFDKITASDKQLKKDSSTYSRTSNKNKKYYNTINSNSERGYEISTKKLRKEIGEVHKKYQKNYNKNKSTANVNSAQKQQRSNVKTKPHERPARIKAALILSNKKGKQSKVVKINSNKSIGDNELSDHSVMGKSTAHTSEYLKRTVKTNKKLENIANMFTDKKKDKEKVKISIGDKIDTKIKNYN